jgi:hypothetical protein
LFSFWRFSFVGLHLFFLGYGENWRLMFLPYVLIMFLHVPPNALQIVSFWYPLCAFNMVVSRYLFIPNRFSKGFHVFPLLPSHMNCWKSLRGWFNILIYLPTKLHIILLFICHVLWF